MKKYLKKESRYLMGKLVLFILVGMSFLLPIHSLPAEGQGEEEADGKVEITFWAFGGLEWEKDWWREKTAQFNKSQPKIKVIYTEQPWPGSPQKIISSFMLDELADVFSNSAESAGEFSEIGTILPLDLAFPDDFKTIIEEKIHPAVIKTGMYEGKVYMIPMYVDGRPMLTYNPNHFSTAGLNPDILPEDWNELLEYAIKIHKATGKYGMSYDGQISGSYHDFMREYVSMAGGRWLSEDKKEVLLDTPVVIDVLKWMIRVKESGVIPPNIIGVGFMDNARLFFADQLAMFSGATWIGGLAQDLGAPEDFEMRLTLYPEAPKEIRGPFPPKRVYIGGYSDLAISSKSKHKQESWEFIKFMLSKDVLRGWAINPGRMPVHKDVLESEEFKTHKPGLYKAYKDGLYEMVSQFEKFAGQSEMESALFEYWQKAINGKMTPEAAMREADAVCQEIYNSIREK